MSSTTILRHAPSATAADALVTAAIEADAKLHGFTEPELWQRTGYSPAKIHRLRIGAESWDISAMHELAKMLRPTSPASLMTGWVHWYADALNRPTYA